MIEEECIEREALCYQLQKQETIDGQPRAIRRARRIVEDFPAADVRKVKHGKWLPIVDADEDGSPYQSGVYCSECGHCDVFEYNFCPNCGADMRGNNG